MYMNGSRYEVKVDNGLSEFKATNAMNSVMHSHHYLLFNMALKKMICST